ncbi:Piso0_000922 [Millerozyma farinosa CBS 7064]|uniref:Piso0_000922 protein n=1 Tax=Pichia sorbitophila (strain ATCC MYA-4447 / BCRC 22081 / CBS 7064 / NBRC 10061 / NRRL Y-12695) TaxID=559304 RepID=G8YRW5_PICSO|nr:Piso0_000922 [Millerozyma farinosa CBS 7064]
MPPRKSLSTRSIQRFNSIKEYARNKVSPSVYSGKIDSDKELTCLDVHGSSDPVMDDSDFCSSTARTSAFNDTAMQLHNTSSSSIFNISDRNFIPRSKAPNPPPVKSPVMSLWEAFYPFEDNMEEGYQNLYRLNEDVILHRNISTASQHSKSSEKSKSSFFRSIPKKARSLATIREGTQALRFNSIWRNETSDKNTTDMEYKSKISRFKDVMRRNSRIRSKINPANIKVLQTEHQAEPVQVKRLHSLDSLQANKKETGHKKSCTTVDPCEPKVTTEHDKPNQSVDSLHITTNNEQTAGALYYIINTTGHDDVPTSQKVQPNLVDDLESLSISQKQSDMDDAQCARDR